ncbi:SRPBCC family protein [Nocardia sp. NPDC051030]|uniref:SRPBCC family protein n=1 Tax=Nocardia sp. NPDC051030 TaxID=3155162 RepID=UPI003418ADD2
MLTVIVYVVVALVVIGAITGGITLYLLRTWIKAVLAGGGFDTRPLTAAQIDEYLAERGTFAVTAEREFPFPPHKVWDALQLNGTFSWIPLINGIRYRDDYRNEGAQRTFDGLLFAAEEKVITLTPGERLTVTGTKISLPFAIKSFAEDYRLTETATGTTLTWTIAFRPRIGSFLPLRWAAPFVRPFAKIGIRGLAARI